MVVTCLPGVRKELRALALLEVTFRGVLNAGVVELLRSELSRVSSRDRPTEGLTAAALLRWSGSGASSPVEVPLPPPVEGKGVSKHKPRSAMEITVVNNVQRAIEQKS